MKYRVENGCLYLGDKQIGPHPLSGFIECQHEAAVEFWGELQKLRKILAHVPARIAIEAKEKAGLRARDREAGEHVEAVIAMRTKFTGEPPYVGWKGLGLALSEALDERDRLQSLNAELLAACKASKVALSKASRDAVDSDAFDDWASLSKLHTALERAIARCEPSKESP